jgi:hypothetical protein
MGKRAMKRRMSAASKMPTTGRKVARIACAMGP